MASLEGTQLWWNGKLNSSSDLLYYDKINVDVVHPPYARRDRNTSYFLQTRKGYAVDEWLNRWLYEESEKFNRGDYGRDHGDQFDVVDIEVIWDDKCEQREGVIYYMCISKERDEKWIVSRTISEGIINNDINLVFKSGLGCTCADEKFFKTTYVKGDGDNIFESEASFNSETGIQINRVEGGAMRGRFTDKKVEDGEENFSWGKGIKSGDYLVIYNSTDLEGDGYCGQVRTIIDYDAIRKELILDSAWSGFQDGENEVRGNNVSYMVFSDWGEVVGFTSGNGVSIAFNKHSAITMCNIGRPGGNAKCVLSSTATADRIFLLYDNGWIHFGGVGRDKFFDSGDAMFCGADKHSIVAYRDFILAMGQDKMAVAVADSTGQYFHMYNQSSTIGIKNKYAFGEYNGDLLICSNDNRLLALKIASSVGQYMLEYEDIGQYINSYLKAMLPSDKCYISVDDNELRVYINTLSDVDRTPNNTRTLVLKYNTIFGVWTCDKLGYALLRGSKYGFYFGDSVYSRKGRVDTITQEKGGELIVKEYTYNIGVSAFLLENEDNGIAVEGRAADLFSLAMLNKLIVLLGLGRYDNANTKIKITEYRNGYGYEQEISSLTNNDWLDKIGAAYEGTSIQLSDCVLSDIKDGSNTIRPLCENGHRIQKPIVKWQINVHNDNTGEDSIETYSEHNYQLTDHSVCVNDEVYKMAPTMPLTIELGDQERFNSQIFIELLSNSDDIVSFGGFFANLSLAPLGYKGGDGEYLIEVDSGC